MSRVVPINRVAHLLYRWPARSPRPAPPSTPPPCRPAPAPPPPSPRSSGPSTPSRTTVIPEAPELWPPARRCCHRKPLASGAAGGYSNGSHSPSFREQPMHRSTAFLPRLCTLLAALLACAGRLHAEAVVGPVKPYEAVARALEEF